MNITRAGAIKELTAWKKMLNKHPSYAEVHICFGTFVSYLSAILEGENGTQQRKDVTTRGRGNGSSIKEKCVYGKTATDEARPIRYRHANTV